MSGERSSSGVWDTTSCFMSSRQPEVTELDSPHAARILITVAFNTYFSNERIHYQSGIVLEMHCKECGLFVHANWKKNRNLWWRKAWGYWGMWERVEVGGAKEETWGKDTAWGERYGTRVWLPPDNQYAKYAKLKHKDTYLKIQRDTCCWSLMWIYIWIIIYANMISFSAFYFAIPFLWRTFVLPHEEEIRYLTQSLAGGKNETVL